MCKVWRSSYNKVEALRGVDFDVARGSCFFALLARPERGGQDHGRENPVHAAAR